jgi:hypothetical protein
MKLGKRINKITELHIDISKDIKSRAPHHVWALLPQSIILSGTEISLSQESDYGTREEIITALEWLVKDLKK